MTEHGTLGKSGVPTHVFEQGESLSHLSKNLRRSLAEFCYDLQKINVPHFFFWDSAYNPPAVKKVQHAVIVKLV
jgi:hypothetical protein